MLCVRTSAKSSELIAKPYTYVAGQFRRALTLPLVRIWLVVFSTYIPRQKSGRNLADDHILDTLAQILPFA
jgi:hypothetical protein